VKFDFVGFLKIFAQSIGISTPSSSRTKEEVERRPRLLKQKDVPHQEQQKGNKAR
jgi:hypothetical protein